jgi:LPS-assembly lipoprotein
MSLPSRLILLIVAACPLLSGCGFQPVYGTKNDAGQLSASELHYIVIDPIPNRVGVRLRAELERLFSPPMSPPQHTLDIRLNVESDVTAIDRDASVRRRNLKLIADVRLLRNGAAKEPPEFTTVVRANAGMEQLPSDFSTLVSESAAEERAVERLAFQIRQQLAVHFARES